jgi:hypothetical protein
MGLTFTRLCGVTLDSRTCHDLTLACVPRNRSADNINNEDSRLGGIVVSVLATRREGCGFEPGQGDEFLRGITIRSTPSSVMGSKAGGPMS